MCGWYTGGLTGDGCDLASTLCKYDFRKGDSFVPSWARVRRVRAASSSCHQTSVFHLSTHFFAVSLNLLKSSNEQCCARRVHCIMCAVFSVARPPSQVDLLRSTVISVSVPCYM